MTNSYATLHRTKMEEKMDSVSNYMKTKKFPTYLYRKIKTYYRHYYNKRTALDERSILSELSTQLRRDVVDFMVGELKGQILKEVPMFKGLDRIHLATLLTVLKPLTASPGEYVVKEGQTTEEMFILMSGNLHARIDGTTEVLAELRQGACFGELAALGLKPTCSTSMVAATYCELFSLSRAAIYEAFNNNFSIIDTMIEKAIDATMDSDLKDSKYRRDSHKVMAEWSNSIGRSISDSSNKSFGKRRGNSKENMKKRVNSTPYMRQRRQSLQYDPDLDQDDSLNADETTVDNDQKKVLENNTSDAISLTKAEFLDLKTEISTGMKEMFKMIEELKIEVKELKNRDDG